MPKSSDILGGARVLLLVAAFGIFHVTLEHFGITGPEPISLSRGVAGIVMLAVLIVCLFSRRLTNWLWLS